MSSGKTGPMTVMLPIKQRIKIPEALARSTMTDE
jgi:hypothetical protein